jgi:hypothetical protein
MLAIRMMLAAGILVSNIPLAAAAAVKNTPVWLISMTLRQSSAEYSVQWLPAAGPSIPL